MGVNFTLADTVGVANNDLINLFSDFVKLILILVLIFTLDQIYLIQKLKWHINMGATDLIRQVV